MTSCMAAASSASVEVSVQVFSEKHSFALVSIECMLMALTSFRHYRDSFLYGCFVDFVRVAAEE